MLSTEPYNLSAGIRAGQIIPYFQPIMSLRTGDLSGFEILARWQHPDRGLLSPDSFIPMAEETGVIRELTDEILIRAAKSAASWPGEPFLSLNISPLELRDRSLPQTLAKTAEAHGFPLRRLKVEITERALIGDFAVARSIAGELKSLGIRLALDDLGTGYASLQHLQALPFDEVKIDACFVKQVTQQLPSRKIVAAMIGLGASLGLTATAEGIEEKGQAEMLACFGCNCGQGWLFGHPLAAAEVPNLIAKLKPNPYAWSDSAYEMSSQLAAMPWAGLAKLRAIYDGRPIGLCFLDRNLRFVKLNRALAEIHDLPLGAHLGRTIDDALPSLARVVTPHLHKAIEGETTHDVDVRLPGPGTEKVLRLSCHPVRNEAGEVVGVSVVTLDITDHKQACIAAL